MFDFFLIFHILMMLIGFAAAVLGVFYYLFFLDDDGLGFLACGSFMITHELVRLWQLLLSSTTVAQWKPLISMVSG